MWVISAKIYPCLHLQHSAFCFSSFSSSSGSAPSQLLQSAAALPWSSQCHRNSDWGSPELRENWFVMPLGNILQPRVTWKDTNCLWRRLGSVPLLSLLEGKRHQVRRSRRLLLWERGEDSVHPFSFTALVLPAFGIPAPLLPLKPPLHTQTHNAISVLLRAFYLKYL